MPERSTWTIRKKRPEPFDTEFGSIVGPAADFPVRVVEESRLRGVERALVEAVIPLEVIAGQDRVKPYTEMSRSLIAQVNTSIDAVRAALASPSSPAPEGGP